MAGAEEFRYPHRIASWGLIEANFACESIVQISANEGKIVTKSVQQPGVDDVDVREAWRRLSQSQDATLIDVRTSSEWTFVGVPDLSSIGKTVLRLEWKSFPEGRINPSFVPDLEAALAAAGATKDTELFFLCRSGGRSLSAAKAMAAAGYRACHNVAGGFEGPPDPQGHRGTVDGWQAAGLPWIQD